MAETHLLEVNETSKVKLKNDGLVFPKIVQSVMAEFVGTILFLFVGLLTLCSTKDVTATGLAFGIALGAYLACFGHISGGHFNPATTVAVLVTGDIHIVLAFIYIIAQLIGGIIAAALVKLIIDPVIYFDVYGGATHLTIPWWRGIIAEAIFTMLLVMVVLMTTTDRLAKTGLAPIIVGFTFAASVFALGSLTGGSMNPARSFGPAVVANSWSHHYVYWAGPLLGALIGGLTYRFLFSRNHQRFTKKKQPI